MNPFVTGLLYAFGGAIGLALATCLIFGGVWFVTRRRSATPRGQPAPPTKAPAVPAPRPSPRPRKMGHQLESVPFDQMTHDEVVRFVLSKAAMLEVAVRGAHLRGVPIDMQLLQVDRSPYPKGAPQLVVRATQADGTKKTWPSTPRA